MVEADTAIKAPLPRYSSLGAWLILFLVCGLTGAIAFGLTNNISGPLVGGSAAIIGMLWAVKYWEFKWIALSSDGWTRYALSIVFLLALNVMMHWLSDGGVATMAHLGGAVGGIAMGPGPVAPPAAWALHPLSEA
jgi:membrane associated rhomboid family serine protease